MFHRPRRADTRSMERGTASRCLDRGGEPNVKAKIYRFVIGLAALSAALVVLGAPQKWG